MSDASDNLAGRLGNPDMTLRNDPRADPRIIQMLVEVDGFASAVDLVAEDATLDECLAYCMAFEEASSVANPAILASLPVLDSIVRSTEVIKGVDDNDITLYIHRPTVSSAPAPCIVHLHGGGMVLMCAEDPGYVRWRDNLADQGMIVIGVEFRNGGGRMGAHPFPAGLNDCGSAVQWAFDNRDKLGISSIVLSGESGGGNLSLATTLKAKHEGWLEAINGVYAMCPYISGSYAAPPKHLLSLSENDGYSISCAQMSTLVRVYDPAGTNKNNPLAWPYHASVAELVGLPPHIISVNELDPLRDEGLSYYRKLLAAGVSAVGQTVHGTPHGGDLSFPDVAADLYGHALRSLSGFARSVA